MTKKKVKVVKYEVVRGIQKDGEWRFEPGDIISAADLGDVVLEGNIGLAAYWLNTGVLREVTNGDG